MGLIRFVGDVVGSGFGALGGAANAAVFKEYFTSGDMSDGILMKRAERVNTASGKNKSSDENLISSGSGIDVQDGQCMIIVDNGRIVEFCCEPGRYVYDNSTSPSLFYGNNKGLKALGAEIMNQWAAGGQRFSTQRVYFINMGEIISAPIKWGLGNIAFTHTKTFPSGYKYTQDMTLKGNGTLTIKISDPVKFYKNIGAQKAGGDNSGLIRITDEGILTTLKSAILDKIGVAISTLGFENELPYTAIRTKPQEISKYINDMLSNEWAGQRGFEVASFSINGAFIPTEEDLKQLSLAEEGYNMTQNPMLAQFAIQNKMAEGVHEAGKNGGASGLMGIGMGMGAIGGNGMGNFGAFAGQNFGAYPQQQGYGYPAQQGYGYPQGNMPQQGMNQPNMQPQGMPQQNYGYQQNGVQQQTPVQQSTQQPMQQNTNFAGVAPVSDSNGSTDNTWVCSCGTKNTGAFCFACGSKKPENNSVQPEKTEKTWTCTCGFINPITSRFCSNCGTKKPTVKKLVCDKCGWTPAPGQNVKFCPQCGDIFNDSDIVEE